MSQSQRQTTLPRTTTSDAATPPRLQARGVRVEFGATVALDGVELTGESGKVCALIGENGAGKSTLMKVLSGAMRPTTGTMQIDGRDYCPANPMDARHAGVAMIYQELFLAPDLTVEQNICLGFEPAGRLFLKLGEMRDRARQVLDRLGHPEISTSAEAGSLSVSQQQIVEIARAVALGCKVLILDEPTSSLSREDVKHLFTLLRQLKAEGYAIFYISHVIEEIQEIADTYTVLRDGKVVGGGSMQGTTPEQIIALMAGRQVENIYPRSNRTAGDVILTVEALRGQTKFQAASLQVRRGEIVGLAGLLGSGRSEFLRAVFGTDRVKSGSVRVGAALRTPTPAGMLGAGVGMLSEDRKTEGLALGMSIADNLILSAPERVSRFGLLSGGLKAAAARQWIDELGVRCAGPHQPIGALSGGNQQKIAIARLLFHDVEVYLLDEPTRGIDVKSKMQIYELMDRLAREGKAVVLVSSYLPELFGLCDRIAVMCRGRLGEARPVSELDEHVVMTEATSTGGGEQ
jgi:ribose transport system ATP-binding protein